MKILLTGADGFTGRHLAAAARAQGHEVVALAGDLRDATAVAAEVSSARAQVVVHLGGIAFAALDDTRAYYDVNLIGSLNLLQALAAAPTRPDHVLLASSATVYGRTSITPISEDTPVAPVNHYAASKLAMEQMASAYGRGLSITCVRPFNYTGRGHDHAYVIPKIVQGFKDGLEAIELGNVEVRREFNDVRDVCDAYLGLLRIATAGGHIPSPLNLCSGRTYSIRQMIAMLVELTGHRPEIRINPAFVRPEDPEEVTGDPSLLRSLLPGALNTPIESTLRWMMGS